ncbi:MAG: phenylalanine--tRNA ligase subunit beta [Nitrospirae bacterium]|nr:phenylalanine--tRNA ligase subunit beta [Nitrospirota bacterium]
MPTITVHQADVEALLGEPFSPDVFEEQLALVKGELDDFDPKSGEIRVELNDTNRPDLWCVEGVVRQIRARRQGRGDVYPFFREGRDTPHELIVDPSVSEVRPFVGACVARGVTVDDTLLAQLIQTQEKVCDVFGRKRRSIAIGIYAAGKLAWPLHYKAVSPTEVRFVPLGMDEPLTLAEIAAMHPKGQQYAPIVADHGRWPLLADNAGTVLSFPPVINSRAVGEVKVGDSELFLEVTGTNLRMVTLVVNILATNMADRGARIEPVRVRYPEATEFGAEVTMPRPIARELRVELDAFTRALGDAVDADEVARELTAYGFSVRADGGAVTVHAPEYRDDLLHTVDVIEDFAIARGYDSFAALMPQEFTVGGLLPIESLADRVREHMVGLGFQEVLSNILVSREELTDHMELHGASLVEVANVMSASYSVLRNAVLPSLLRVERESGKAFYPHQLFEVGEVALPRPDAPMGSETRTQMAALVAHPEANFSELAARLEMLSYYLNVDHTLEPVDHASYIPGRAGRITVGGVSIGLIGELSPEVLGHWGITVPCAAFEVDLSALLPG